ncbi:uncharacterized protein CDAR_27001 [Caerostris darwini]|uniref:Adenomatous polyposis coli protein n=1 Tax=Caerostris darwini TaxID=1538125 RepID=A0AAV4T9F3_9ARAC|nr:uncharacterized protein CDAR_27001 [Caerostris darwini]
MLGYNNGQTVQPSYNYYLETDLDNVDEQPIDFSKRYDDQDSEEACCSTSGEKGHLAPATMNSDSSKQLDDEVKVYCIEGTPLMISSASSLCDLREVGNTEQTSQSLISKPPFSKKPCFSTSSRCSNISEEDNEKRCDKPKSIANEMLMSNYVEKEELCKNDEIVNLEADAAFTRTSSPLMFSRYSSLGSLNSFEKQSFADDKSVSTFSNLTSGIISPSEIPDSPGEVMSPFIQKSKNNEFQFPVNNKSMEPILDKLKTTLNGQFVEEIQENFSEDDIKVYNDEGDCSSVSNLSALSILTNSTRLSGTLVQHKKELISLANKSSVQINYSITTEDTNFEQSGNNHLLTSNANFAPQHNCINNFSNFNDCTVGNSTNQVEKNNAIGNKVLPKCEDKGTSTSEDFNFLETESNSQEFKEKSIEIIYPQENESADYSKDNSDDECDALLEECILNGMPRKDDLVLNDSKKSLNNSFPDETESLTKETTEEQNCSYSDNDISDDDILDECIQLGMPQKVSKNVQPIVIAKSSALQVTPLSKGCLNSSFSESSVFNQANLSLKPAISNHQSLQKRPNVLKSVESPAYVENMPFHPCVKLGTPKTPKLYEETNVNKRNISLICNSISSAENQQRKKKTDVSKCDDDSNNDQNGMLIQGCIQLSMPRNQLKSYENLKVMKLPNTQLGYRDNCPDGISDDDDDDDILSECIKAGMPDAEILSSGPQYTEQTKSRNVKLPSQRKLTAAEDRAMYLKKYCGGNMQQEFLPNASELIAVDDSMCVYRTEDTPLLSPTASLSDLSTLSFAEEKLCQESFLNNSRNSDCSSESEDDELLLQCIRSGMPGEKRAVA